jgi:hypothetical protein
MSEARCCNREYFHKNARLVPKRQIFKLFHIERLPINNVELIRKSRLAAGGDRILRNNNRNYA